MILSVTGPRPIHMNSEYDYKGPVSAWVRNELSKKIAQYKPDTLMSRMALGVDTIFALMAIEMGIPLFAVIPFIGQESKWQKPAQDLYHRILTHPKTITKIVCTPGYSDWKFQKGNEFMCNECDVLIGVTYETKKNGVSGTKNCIDYAVSIKKNIDIIDLKNYK